MLCSRNRPNRPENRSSRHGHNSSRGCRCRPRHPQGSRELSHRWCPAGSTSGQAGSPCQRRSPPRTSRIELRQKWSSNRSEASLAIPFCHSMELIAAIFGARVGALRPSAWRKLAVWTAVRDCLIVSGCGLLAVVARRFSHPAPRAKPFRHPMKWVFWDFASAASGSIVAQRMADTCTPECSTGVLSYAWVKASAACNSCKGPLPCNEGKTISPDDETGTSHLRPGASGSTAVQRMADTRTPGCSTGLQTSAWVRASAPGNSCKVSVSENLTT